MIDRIYFVIQNYNPSERLGICYNSKRDEVNKSSGEINEKTLFKLEQFDLSYSANTNCTSVNGSIRKFYFGRNSIEDFGNKEEFKHALYLLSLELKIPYKMLLACEIYSLEIGKNFKVSTNPAFIVDSIQKLSRLKPKRYVESVTFIGSNYDFIVYDKIEEIKQKNKRITNPDVEKEYILRMELKLKKRKAIRDRFRNDICSLHDILALFEFCPYILYHEIERLELNEKKLDAIHYFSGESIKDFKDYLYAIGIHAFGLENALNMAIKLQGVEKSLNNRRVFKKIASLIKLKKSSNNEDWLEDIKSQLNISDERLETLDILSDDFCYHIPLDY